MYTCSINCFERGSCVCSINLWIVFYLSVNLNFIYSTQAMKFAFAQRSLLEDSDNLQNITSQMLRYCVFTSQLIY